MTDLVKGKAGFVTGAASGIGRGVALELAREGAAVVVSDLASQAEGGAETVRLIEAAGGQASFFAADVSKASDVDALTARVRETFGKIDFAVNNAGIGPHSLINDITDDEFDAVMGINLKGVLYGIQSASRAFREQGTPGAIVNTSSVAGVTAIPGIGSYTASKHGINGLTITAAKEYGDDGIRVNAIMPNAIRTPFAESVDNYDEFVAALTAPQAIKRLGEPEEVGFAVAFLVSDRASYITGVTLPVDGGYLTGA